MPRRDCRPVGVTIQYIENTETRLSVTTLPYATAVARPVFNTAAGMT